MGNALSIAAVSRVLRQVVEGNMTRTDLDGYVGTDVTVTTVPPDDDNNSVRINLFLYKVSETPQLRNAHYPTHNKEGERIRRPVLSLDLQYAVTAYATGDSQSEMMLGCAVQAFHETPILNRELIQSVLALDGGANTLLDSRLAEQLESISIRHRNFSEDVFSRIWSTFHTAYRLTAFYEVSVAFIESDLEANAIMPVLARPLPEAHGNLDPVTPTLLDASPEPAIAAQVVTLAGLSLEGDAVQVEVDNRSFEMEIPPIAILPANVSETAIAFTVPNTWPVGIYDLRVTMEPTGGGIRRPSNRLSFNVAPSWVVANINRGPLPDELVAIEFTLTPQLRASQSVTLILGPRMITGPAINVVTNSVTFADIDIDSGAVVTRLRVDGIESPWINRDVAPATILPAAIINVP